MPDYGALVISLDFEQHWGMRDGAPARRNGHAPRADPGPVVAGMLDLFEEFDVAATWATVGFLFARSKRELEHFAPPPRRDRPTRTRRWIPTASRWARTRRPTRCTSRPA